MRCKNRSLLAILIIIAIVLLSSCRFNEEEEPLIVSGDFPVVYVKRPQESLHLSVESREPNRGSDLYWRDVSSPKAVEQNLTFQLTLGNGEVADPEVSYDGNQLIFSMRCTVDSAPTCNTDFSWNIWRYDIPTNEFSRVIPQYEIANDGDDIDPAFLPDGRIVFSSTRQKTMQERVDNIFKKEENKMPASVLHVMTAEGSNIEQISFNQGDDLNPSVLESGKILFSRYEMIEGNKQYSIYSANPDGTDMDVLYGSHSPGEVFLHPREIASGKLISTVIPMQGTWEGGALLTLDVENYADADAPAPNVVELEKSGQQSASLQSIPFEKTVSKLGRFTTPYPLLDGSNDVLVSFSFFQEVNTEENILDRIDSINDEESTPLYGIYMLNLDDKSLKPLALPEKDFVLTDPVALFPRQPPNEIPRQVGYLKGALDLQSPSGILNIRSIYDVDENGNIGQAQLTAKENAETPIPLINSNVDRQRIQPFVIDIEKLKNPTLTAANQRPLRFVRITEKIPVPEELPRHVLGESEYLMHKIIGYAPIEPDGSIRIEVPADVPLSLAVLDSYGRMIDEHKLPLQVRPGEELKCNGCHSPRKYEPLNSSPIAGNHRNTNLKSIEGFSLNAVPMFDETMAETRTRLDERALHLTTDIIFTDVWQVSSFQTIDNTIRYSYSTLDTPRPDNGIINYETHIQPIWERARFGELGNHSCASCHNGSRSDNNPTLLDLSGGIGSVGRMLSYDNLLIGNLVYDENGFPVYDSEEQGRQLKRQNPLVFAGNARKSHLIEKLFNEELFAEQLMDPGGVNHLNLLTADEKRLIVEWIDIGAQYFNHPYDANGELVKVENPLDLGVFGATIYFNMLDGCAFCHSANTVFGEINPNFVDSRLVFTRDVQADFNMISSLVNNLDQPEMNPLLSVPSGFDRHPAVSTGSAYLPEGSPLYREIFNWIANARDSLN